MCTWFQPNGRECRSHRWTEETTSSFVGVSGVQHMYSDMNTTAIASCDLHKYLDIIQISLFSFFLFTNINIESASHMTTAPYIWASRHGQGNLLKFKQQGEERWFQWLYRWHDCWCWWAGLSISGTTDLLEFIYSKIPWKHNLILKQPSCSSKRPYWMSQLIIWEWGYNFPGSWKLNNRRLEKHLVQNRVGISNDRCDIGCQVACRA